ALQQARLLACDHYHVIFTLPHDLNPLWLANVQMMTTLLFQAVRDTLCTLLADSKYLGAQPGILTALHTWSQTLVLHPHLHCLVPGGGLTPDGRWQAVRNGFLLPARVGSCTRPLRTIILPPNRVQCPQLNLFGRGQGHGLTPVLLPTCRVGTRMAL